MLKSTATLASNIPAREEVNPRQALNMGMNKLKGAPNNNLCKRVLLINSMDAMVEKTPSSLLGSLFFRFRNKQEWRRAMVSEFINTPDRPDIPFHIKGTRNPKSVDELCVLLNCLEITKKKRNITQSKKTSQSPGGKSRLRPVKSKTIDKIAKIPLKWKGKREIKV